MPPPHANVQMDKSFLRASIPDVVGRLTIDEKIDLLAGRDFWNIKVTDGPNGARGESFYKMCPASAIPNATALGSTFSPDLIEEVSAMLSKEVKARNAVCLLAPTINIPRSPLGGRVFESYSEDPTLSGILATSFVSGLQKQGISATIKHFICNDQEHERTGIDSRVADRALREIYLRPFQIAQSRASPMAYMTSYNKVNGTHCSEDPWLQVKLLRGEWGFGGLTMSDWRGTYSVSEAINARLNLEMPGPSVWRQRVQVKHLIQAHKISRSTIDANVGDILTWVQTLAKRNEDLVYRPPQQERTRYGEIASDSELIRRVGGEGLVLLKNDNALLPVTGPKRVAVIGPNAKARVLTGGGSAQLRAAWSVSPWDGLVKNAPNDITLEYALGTYTAKALPDLDAHFTALDGSPGLNLYHYSIGADGERASRPAVDEVSEISDLNMMDFKHPELGDNWVTELRALFTAPVNGFYTFGLTVTGQAVLKIDGKVILDTQDQMDRGGSFFANGTNEILVDHAVEKGCVYELHLSHDSRIPPGVKYLQPTPFRVVGVRIGAAPRMDGDADLEDAVNLAAQADVAIVIAGLNADWESETFDRPSLALPLRSNELITRVAEANLRTVVIIQAGSAVSMPWVDQVAGIIYAWYGGNETGNAIADIVYGARNPSGRLPLTFPRREEDIPAFFNLKSARTKVYYDEGVWVGYRWYNGRKIAPLFPFGHGLSYTTFEYLSLRILEAPAPGCSAAEWRLVVQVRIRNTGSVQGSHSVHLYSCPPPESATGLLHPSHAFQNCAKIYHLQPGQASECTLVLDKFGVSHWDELTQCWRVEAGTWQVAVGKDAQTLVLQTPFQIDHEISWTGV